MISYDRLKYINDERKLRYKKEYEHSDNKLYLKRKCGFSFYINESGNLHVKNSVSLYGGIWNGADIDFEITTLRSIYSVINEYDYAYFTNLSFLKKYMKQLYMYKLHISIYDRLIRILNYSCNINSFTIKTVLDIDAYISKFVLLKGEILLEEFNSLFLLKKDNNFELVCIAPLYLTYPISFSGISFKNCCIKDIVFSSNMESFKDMFSTCMLLETVFFENVNTNNIRDMSGMFFNCKNLIKTNIACLNTKKVMNMDLMFYKCFELRDIGGPLDIRFKSIRDMFFGCDKLNEKLIV